MSTDTTGWSGWNVRRVWWELTKLVLAGRGGYALFVSMDDELSEPAQDEFDAISWAASRLDSVGGEDRFVNILVEPSEYTDA